MKTVEQLLQEDAATAVATMNMTEVLSYTDQVMNSGQMKMESGADGFESAKQTLIALVNRKNDLIGKPGAGPTPTERAIKLRDEGRDTEADFLVAGMKDADAITEEASTTDPAAVCAEVNVKLAEAHAQAGKEFRDRVGEE